MNSEFIESRKKITKLIDHCLNQFPTDKNKATEHIDIVYKKGRINLDEYERTIKIIDLYYVDFL